MTKGYYENSLQDTAEHIALGGGPSHEYWCMTVITTKQQLANSADGQFYHSSEQRLPRLIGLTTTAELTFHLNLMATLLGIFANRNV